MSGEKEKKKLLRKKIKGLLSKYDSSLVETKSNLIQSYLFSLTEYKNSCAVMFYVSRGNEVYTHEIIKVALGEKKEVSVPFILKSQNITIPCKINDFSNLEPGPFGILQPSKEKIRNIPIESIDLVIVPGIAFDRKGNRVGKGKGFYDRFLKSINATIPKIALAFSMQIVEQISTTENDVAVDKIITEDGIINCML
ncbi:MAG: 5-formyltetrahydrofolate cyclo-ligase [Candidatus Omnitrophica bacterium]|nr:5-formyltetrahydrofolate cyclo-ligase [Candidatus Omnitrophota bacterium]MBU1047106.1 5-formyltetrahydrofolate cyclo-ligase [Candidatus Omnitrophota bacterium]MBU1630530.1 5-formyltetrahydrofolate cyclo-ligase [Candidatus Omnitrophota bacterium]MBU1889012.1 5-formyltetrahydrofolate cyclo-ligase [Candidatus Omnitrophota bacterium]